MLYRDICKVLGLYIFAFTATLLVPLVLAIYYEYYLDPLLHPQPHSTWAFAKTIMWGLIIGGILYLIGRKSKGTLYRREGILVVVIIWFISPAIGALPFTFSGTLDNSYQAYFEAVSGITTTGSTVMQAKNFDPTTGEEIPIKDVVKGDLDTYYEYYGTINPVRDPATGKILYTGIEAVGKAVLFWRSFIQWLGGLGVVVVFVAILPVLGIGSKVLYRAEVAGPVKDTLTPRVAETAMQLLKIYAGLTIAEIILLMMTNDQMPLFDAITISLTTLPTGGFSIKNASIGFYNNAYTEIVVMIFMLCGGINFALYYYVLKGKFFKIYDLEFILFIIFTVLSCSLASWYLIGTETTLLTGEKIPALPFWDAVRYGYFQVISSNTTTGFSTVDFDTWPFPVQIIMVIMMYVGAMSGSTTGGIKTIRHYMLFRIAQDKVESIFRPENVRSFRVGEREMGSETAIMVLCFFLTLMAVSVASTFLLVLDGIDPETAFSVTACSINNVGLAFRAAGPTESFAFLSDFGAILQSLTMLLGRLEFFAVLAILVPAFWKHDS